MNDVIINGNSLYKNTGVRLTYTPKMPITNKRYSKKKNINGGEIYSDDGLEDRVILLELNYYDKGNAYEVSRKLSRFLSESETLSFSDDPDIFYKVKQVRSSDIEVGLNLIGKLNVEFTISAYGYIKSEKIVLTEKGKITNIGNIYSEPVINVYAKGDVELIIAQQVIKLTNINGSITLDTPILEAYKGTEILNTHVNGELPIFPENSFSITWSGTVEKIELIPNWRFL